jgi:hypothetical protein
MIFRIRPTHYFLSSISSSLRKICTIHFDFSVTIRMAALTTSISICLNFSIRETTVASLYFLGVLLCQSKSNMQCTLKFDARSVNLAISEKNVYKGNITGRACFFSLTSQKSYRILLRFVIGPIRPYQELYNDFVFC